MCLLEEKRATLFDLLRGIILAPSIPTNSPPTGNYFQTGSGIKTLWEQRRFLLCVYYFIEIYYSAFTVEADLIGYISYTEFIQVYQKARFIKILLQSWLILLLVKQKEQKCAY